MKKQVLFALLALATVIGFNSCRRTNCTCDHHEPEPCKFNTFTCDLRLASADWQWDDQNQQFYYHFEVPEMTSTIYNYGVFTVYREYGKGTNGAYQVALPQTICNAVEVSAGNYAYYTQHIDYAYGLGFIEIILTNSDYFYDQNDSGQLINPESMDFRVQIVY
ncbi:MAG: hypothetical protein K6A36_03745 [Paludibacteraceae bacterium]|nr:hypothetical protein [Paludibacteraceae bacterium]